MADKLYDLNIKVGTYEKDGETRNRYQSIGAVLQGQYGPYMLLDKIINIAGAPGQEDRSSVIVSMFPPKKRDHPDDAQPAPAKRTQEDDDFDSIPF